MASAGKEHPEIEGIQNICDIYKGNTKNNLSNTENCQIACWDCRHACQKVFFNHCIKQGKEHVSFAHIKSMTDCMEICQITADFIVRNSGFKNDLIKMCIKICEECGNSCRRIEDEQMQVCAQSCFDCALACSKALDESN